MALIFLSNAALFCGASAQDPVLTGTVADTESERGLPRAHVFIASSMIGTTTDRDGKFVLEGVPPGAHRLVVTMLGYESVHVTHCSGLDIHTNLIFTLSLRLLSWRRLLLMHDLLADGRDA
ncbi:MAG: carboxypeptidase-like regulatory domain-containing protein [Bacteroidota bacterium]|nr:carboxypeptidase-like regulatory domain-containing protein [Bacteroidota bacterium]